VKRVAYLALAAVVALLILAPAALAQDMVPGDDDPYLPEPEATVVEHAELERIAGQPVPSQPPAKQPLPKTGGPAAGALLLPAAGLLLGCGVLAYTVFRRSR
jgi:hypothetical protein